MTSEHVIDFAICGFEYGLVERCSGLQAVGNACICLAATLFCTDCQSSCACMVRACLWIARDKTL